MKMHFTFRVAKTKAPINFAVTAKVICVFVLAYANCWFSHEVAQMIVAKSHSAILHICSISLRCDPSWFFNGETKCR